MNAIYESKIQKQSTKDHTNSRHLIGPIADFALMGGGSIIPLLLLAYIWPHGSDTAAVAGVALLVANIINHPHFAHSYQIFYYNFTSRAFGNQFPKLLRYRYIFAAILVPSGLALFFLYCITAEDLTTLGKATNLMLFLVGWHYVKQGYGMLMVDAALKRKFFDEKSKKILMLNAYSIWIVSWITINRNFTGKDFWGIPYYSYPMPDEVFIAFATLAAATTTLFLYTLLKKHLSKNSPGIPWNGVAAYATSLYLWLLVKNPAMLLMIPAFHSLQYLAVIWRYRINFEKIKKIEDKSFSKSPQKSILTGFLIFIFSGFLLGYSFFWLIPEWLNHAIPYDKNKFGTTLFLFVFWIFINVHHYFMDNVIWRKDNPDTRSYLFGAK